MADRRAQQLVELLQGWIVYWRGASHEVLNIIIIIIIIITKNWKLWDHGIGNDLGIS